MIKRNLLYAILVGALLAIVGTSLYYGILCVWGDPPLMDTYDGVLEDADKQVYDGDTIKDVRVVLLEQDFTELNFHGEYWPGVWITKRGVEIQTDVRIAGIDTPEKRVSTKNPDGSKRSEASRTRERQASYAARDALIKLLKSNSNEFVLSNPIHGKYAGRTVANVSINGIDVALFLINQGHARFYDGGKKVPFQEWYKRDIKTAPKAPATPPTKGATRDQVKPTTKGR